MLFRGTQVASTAHVLPALAALSLLPVLALREEQVSSVKQMAALAMRLASVNCGRAYAAQRIQSGSDCLQMFGIDARAIAAFVIELETVRDFPDEGHIRNAMCPSMAARSICMAANSHPGIPVSVNLFEPVPAPGLRIDDGVTAQPLCGSHNSHYTPRYPEYQGDLGGVG